MFKVEVEGFDELQRELKELGDAASALNGVLCDIRFDPGDQKSVLDAIARMQVAVDAKVARWKNNAAVREVAARSKQDFREQILRAAAEGSRK